MRQSDHDFVIPIPLDSVVLAYTARVPVELANQAKLESYMDHVRQEMVYHLSVEVAAFRVDTKKYRYPRDWKEALKERFAPGWARRRWPVRYIEGKIEAKAIFPALKTFPDGPHYMFIPKIEQHEFETTE